MIAYLWPLLIILFSAFLPGEKLKTHHVLGGLLGLSGAFLIVSKGGVISFDAQYGLGYGAAALCAVIWSGYSVLSRRFSNVPKRGRNRVLRGIGNTSVDRTSGIGRYSMAAINDAVVGSYWPWSWSGRAGFLCVGLWREERQYPNSGRCQLCRSSALNLRADRCRVSPPSHGISR